jgi:outer membrane protein assembly factor BamE (lipoprotein component of BamABCDE complex)
VLLQKDVMSISDSRFMSRRRMLAGAVSLSISGLVAGCTPEINHRGYYVKPGSLDQIRNGMGKPEVESIMGSPSTTASVNFQGDSYYYITSVTQGRSFLDPKEINRQIIAIRFDKQDQVQGLAQYTLEDGKIINILDRKTPVVGQEFSFLKELFRNTSVGPSDSILKRKL